MQIGEKVMATEKNKGAKWDGKSRVSNELYRKRHEEIFGKREQDELNESYKQSLKNKKEREENEEYVKELQDKL
jgi:hypothetical protein|tara:strand:+ start:1537 stop:1758 length:222 start_codon:yes stop_codon:yes gene_type:complete